MLGFFYSVPGPSLLCQVFVSTQTELLMEPQHTVSVGVDVRGNIQHFQEHSTVKFDNCVKE